MEARTDHSTSGKPNLDNPDPGLERSRFLNALGFGRSGTAETTPEAGHAETPEAVPTDDEEVSEVETGNDGATSFPTKGFQPGPAPKSFEPLANLDSEAPTVKEEKGEPKEEAASLRDASPPADEKETAEPAAETNLDEGADDDDEGSAHDPDGMALRGDEGGPDFLAAKDEEETDDWEKTLLVDREENKDASDVSTQGDENDAVPRVEAETDPVEESATGIVSGNAEPAAGEGGFAWMLAGAKAEAEEDDLSHLLVAGDEEPDSASAKGDFSFLLNHGGEASKEDGEETSEVAPKPLDFETFSQRLKSAPLWKAPERAEVVGDLPDSAESPETEDREGFDPESILVDHEDGSDVFQVGQFAENEAPTVTEAASTQAPEPTKPAGESEPLDSGAEGGDAGKTEAIAETNTEAESKATPEPTQETMANSQSSPSPEESSDDSSPSSASPENSESSESKPGIAIAPAASDIVDVACPECGKGLSLRREHLGIAGHCVWCESPLVAAASAADGAVRVFLLKPGAKPVVENQSPEVEPVESETPSAPVSEPAPVEEETIARETKAIEVPLPTPEARISPWTQTDQEKESEAKPTDEAEAEPSDEANSPGIEPIPEAESETSTHESDDLAKNENESPVSEEVGETVEPEVLGSVEETIAELEKPASPTTSPAWQVPGAADAASSLWAERAAAVHQSLTGAGSNPDTPAGEKSSEEPASQSLSQAAPPADAEMPRSSASAFSWMDPKPAPGITPSSAPVEEKPAESESSTESEKLEATSDAEEPSNTDQPWSAPAGKSEPEPAGESEAAASTFEWKPPSSSTPPADPAPAPFPAAESVEDSTEPAGTEPDGKPESAIPSGNSPFNWKAPTGGDEEPPANDESDAKSEKDEAGKSAPGNDPFAGITAALAQASEADEKAGPPASKMDEESSGPFENLSKFLSDPGAASSPLMSPREAEKAPTEREPEAESTPSPASLWPDEAGKKEGNDPFAAAGSDETDDAGTESAFEATTNESESSEKSEGLKSTAAGSSLFAAAMGSAAPSTSTPESKSSPASGDGESGETDETVESKDQPVPEVEKAETGKAEDARPEPSKADAKKAAKEEIKARKQAEQARKKSEKAKAAETKSKAKKSDTGKKKGGLIKWIFLALVIGGLVVGIAAAALMKEKLSETILPRLQPLLEKIMPSREEAAPEAGADVEAAAATSEKDDPSSLDVPVTGPVSPAGSGSVESADSSSTTEPPSVTTGSVRPTAKPAVVPVPEKKNLFGSGPLLINDGGTEENESSSE